MPLDQEDMLSDVDPKYLKSSVESVRYWYRCKKKQSEIALILGVSRARISQLWAEAGLPKTPRQTVRAQFPWKIEARFKSSELHKLLANHAEFYATNGEGMSRYKLKRLLSFYGRLKTRNVVVEYHPDVESNPDSGMGGFRLVPRMPEDGDLIVRINEVTELTEEARRIFRMPRQLPKVEY